MAERRNVSASLVQVTISQLKAELEKGPQEAAVYTQQIHELRSNLNNLQQQHQVSLSIYLTHTNAHTHCRKNM